MEAFKPLRAEDPEQVGPYRILARLGAGGMGTVYLGRSGDGQDVAVKVVRPELAEDAEFRRRFTREVAAARRVDGAFTAGLVGADTEAPTPWLATVYVPGSPLGDAVGRHGPWPETSVVALGAGLAEALGAVHAAGVVHRDLKPSNILLAPDGPRVIDFGIAVATEASALTRTGIVVGSAGFMSPEQLLGGRVGPAGDVFSLGAVLAFTATGTGPFGNGSAHAVHYRTVHEEPRLDGIAPGLRAVVARCLAKEAGERPSTAGLFEELGRSSGEGGPTRQLVRRDWLPAPVAETVRLRADLPPPLPATDGAGTAPVAGKGRALTRRRMLLGAAGVAVAAGAGFGASELSDGAPAGGSARPSPDRAKPTDGAKPEAPAGTRTGKQVWKVPAAGPLGAASVHDGTVCFAGPTTLFALSAADGERKWLRRFRPTADTRAPLVQNGRVHAVFGGELRILDAGSGRVRWEFPGVTKAADVLSLDGDVLVRTPKKLWKLSGPEGRRRRSLKNVAALTQADGVLYFLHKGSLHALDPGSWREVWSGRKLGGDVTTGTLAVHGGTLHAGLDDGTLRAFDTRTGRPKWTFRLPGAARTRMHFTDDHVYAAGDDALYAVGGSGEQEGEYSLVPSGSSSPAPVTLDVAGDTVYLGLAGRVHAVDRVISRTRWDFGLPEERIQHVVVSGDVVYAACGPHLFALHAHTAKKLWDVKAPGNVTRPVVADDVVYFTGGGTAYAVRA